MYFLLTIWTRVTFVDLPPALPLQLATVFLHLDFEDLLDQYEFLFVCWFSLLRQGVAVPAARCWISWIYFRISWIHWIRCRICWIYCIFCLNCWISWICLFCPCKALPVQRLFSCCARTPECTSSLFTTNASTNSLPKCVLHFLTRSVC